VSVGVNNQREREDDPGQVERHKVAPEVEAVAERAVEKSIFDLSEKVQGTSIQLANGEDHL